MQIYKEFHLEAAHYLPSAPAGHANARVHGHSFRVRVAIEGEPDPETGVVVHFNDMSSALEALRGELDHNFLNEVPGLENPTLENLSKWIWNRLSVDFPGLAEVAIARESCDEGCVYRGPAGQVGKTT